MRRCGHLFKHGIFSITGILLLITSGLAQSSSDLVYSSGTSYYFPYTNEKSSTPVASQVMKLEERISKKTPFKTILCVTREERQVEVYYFPGTSAKRAMVIGGVHGSELSSIELAYHIIEQLSNGLTPYYNVIIIPSLFPDNAAKAMVENNNRGGMAGRYSTEFSPDPNRQMPVLGKPFDPAHPVDHHERPVEPENQYLLYLIQQFNPERIANLHAIRDIERAGVFADPRTDHTGVALGFSSDSLLAAAMARIICVNGGKIASQFVDSPQVVYHKDPPPVPAGAIQPRNVLGSNLPHNRGKGISLGSWATTAVFHPDSLLQREAITLLTIEFPGYKSSVFLHNEQKINYLLNLRLYSLALTSVFLRQ